MQGREASVGAHSKATPSHRRRNTTGEETAVEPSTTHHDSGVEHAASEQAGDRAGAGDLPCGGAQGSALELQRGAGTTPSRESRTSSATDPGAFRPVQGESRASP